MSNILQSGTDRDTADDPPKEVAAARTLRTMRPSSPKTRALRGLTPAEKGQEDHGRRRDQGAGLWLVEAERKPRGSLLGTVTP